MARKTITTTAQSLFQLLTTAEKARIKELKSGRITTQILVRNEGMETVYFSFLATATVANGMPIKPEESHAFSIDCWNDVSLIAGADNADFVIEAK